ncbi:MAG: TIM barrel protein [Propionibacteriaceae bacterium]|jgi:hydroxypyruvate isomerase|nr:TIM barrel protein [Propionibacteriaceae bacterium]
MRYTANCSILLTDLPLAERFQAVRRAGLTGVELWWPFDRPDPGPAQIDALTAALERAGVELTGLNFDAGDMAGGDRGLVSWPGRAERFRANVAAVGQIARATGCRCFNALYGLRQPGHSPAEQDALASANLAWAARAVAEFGGTILIEPVSGAPDYPLKKAADALAVIDRVEAEQGLDNLGLLLDVYHLANNGDDVDAVIAAHHDREAHVQIADRPGRGAPGTGQAPLRCWLQALAEAGYDGAVGLEYVSPPGQDPFAWLAQD